GVGCMREPGLVNFDLSIFKNFALREGMRLQFRSEFFNVSNTPFFGLPEHNRSDGRVRWSIALSISDTGLVASAASDHFLAVAERLRTYEGGTGSTQLLIPRNGGGAPPSKG